MELHRRWVADAAASALTSTLKTTPLTPLHARDSNPPSTSSHSQAISIPSPSSTIAPYHTALNGVNQPMNMLFGSLLWWMLGIAGVTILLIRFAEIAWAKFRQVNAMTMPRERDKQAYWRVSQSSWMPGLKKHLIYAPLWSKRHNREFKLSSAINVGTLPSRLHSLLLLVYLVSNTIYMFALRWTDENRYAVCAELRGRSGTLAMINMVPLIIFAGRNNPLIPLLKISFDTYNLLHRWMGRIIVVEIVVHVIAWAIPAIADMGMNAAIKDLFNDPFMGAGTIGTICMIIIFVASVSPVRHAFYETFLNSHIILAAVVFCCTVIHCAAVSLPGGLPQLKWIMAVIAIWFGDRAARIVRLIYANWTRKDGTYAICEAMPCRVTRVTLHLPRYLDVQPGTHAYLRFCDVNPWESHPFSIAWVDHNATGGLPFTEKQSMRLSHDNTSTAVSFLIGAQTGMTRKLFEKTQAAGRSIRLKAALEGPYAGHHSLDSYGHAVLFAGSTGITHQLSYIRHALDGFNDGTSATRRLTLVWIIREYDSLEWIRPYMDTILRIPHRKDILRIHVFVTRPHNAQDVTMASSTIRMFPGRPNIPLLLVKEVQEQCGAMCVSVCGPGALADDVRGAVRAVQGDSVVDFVEESFTW